MNEALAERSSRCKPQPPGDLFSHENSRLTLSLSTSVESSRARASRSFSASIPLFESISNASATLSSLTGQRSGCIIRAAKQAYLQSHLKVQSCFQGAKWSSFALSLSNWAIYYCFSVLVLIFFFSIVFVVVVVGTYCSRSSSSTTRLLSVRVCFGQEVQYLKSGKVEEDKETKTETNMWVLYVVSGGIRSAADLCLIDYNSIVYCVS